MQSVTWTFGRYVENGKLGLLHHYIIKKWYGEDVLKDLIAKGYVVDHLDNDGYNCRISNLEFLLKSHNTAKGQSFDIDAKNIRERIAVTLYKDFTTDYYQITIGCNDPICIRCADGKVKPIAVIRLLYSGDYFTVVNKAENIIRIYDTENEIEIDRNKLINCEMKEAVPISKEYKDAVAFISDGKLYVNIDNEKVSIRSISMKKGWK